jgi:hypothetical protein
VDTLNAQSSPPATVVELYADWSREPPTGVVADIASIRNSLIEPIQALQRAGCLRDDHAPVLEPRQGVRHTAKNYRGAAEPHVPTNR